MEKTTELIEKISAALSAIQQIFTLDPSPRMLILFAFIAWMFTVGCFIVVVWRLTQTRSK